MNYLHNKKSFTPKDYAIFPGIILFMLGFYIAVIKGFHFWRSNKYSHILLPA